MQPPPKKKTKRYAGILVAEYVIKVYLVVYISVIRKENVRTSHNIIYRQ